MVKRSKNFVSELTLLNNSVPIESNGKPIVFISDLHFDFTKGKYNAKAATQMKDDFIRFVKEQYADSLLCLAGDFFNDYKKTLSFVKELEQNQVLGFFVLGNHDYWNNGTKSHTDIINLFDTENLANQYFRFLVTGRKYYYNDICIIGDTGWTSFRRGKRRVALKRFLGLPDAKKVRDFSTKKIIDMHDEWVTFANGVLKQEEKVLILTHFPMADFTEKDEDCWWSSQTSLIGENSWRIFGHTHEDKQQQDNNVSSQRGYENSSNGDLQHFGDKQYSSYDFGRLEKVIDRSKIIALNKFETITKFYSPMLVSNTCDDLALVSTVKRRGYKRCSANKYNFAFLANSPEAYIERVKQVTNWYLRDTYIGYNLLGYIPMSVFDAIFSSIEVLISNNLKDIRAFITAAVITGYVFNGKPFLIQQMRPLDDYDIMRFWLMFTTIKQYKIDTNSIYSVRSDNKNHIEFCNVEIRLPAVNDLALTINDVHELMQQTSLLPLPVTLLESEGLEDISCDLE